MKEIMIQYGSALIAMLVACSLFVLFMRIPFQGKNGVAAALGEWIREESQNPLMHREGDPAYDNYQACEHLEIYYVQDHPIMAGERTEVDRHFCAVDASGNTVPLVVRAVLDNRGNQYGIQKEEGKEYLYLETAGIYRIYLETADSGRRPFQAVIAFPVQSS